MMSLYKMDCEVFNYNFVTTQYIQQFYHYHGRVKWLSASVVSQIPLQIKSVFQKMKLRAILLRIPCKYSIQLFSWTFNLLTQRLTLQILQMLLTNSVDTSRWSVIKTENFFTDIFCRNHWFPCPKGVEILDFLRYRQCGCILSPTSPYFVLGFWTPTKIHTSFEEFS